MRFARYLRKPPDERIYWQGKPLPVPRPHRADLSWILLVSMIALFALALAGNFLLPRFYG